MTRSGVPPDGPGAARAVAASPATRSPSAATKRLTLIATILGSSIAILDSSVVSVALPSIQRDLGGGLAGQQWVSNAYLLMLGSLILLGGSLGDIFGERRVFALGVAGFGVASLLCALARATASGSAGVAETQPIGASWSGSSQRSSRVTVVGTLRPYRGAPEPDPGRTAVRSGAMTKGRLEAFSDGVIAVAITVLALELPVPKPGAGRSLAHELLSRWPNFAAFAVSFLTIGIIWINHRAMLERVAVVDHRTLLLNLMLLLTVCLLPFSTALMADYLKASDGQRIAAGIYAGSFLLMSVVFFAMQVHVLRLRPHLLHQTVTAEIRDRVLRRNAAGVLPYVAATVLAAVSPYATLALTAAVAAFYAAPSTTADVAGAQPAGENYS